MTVKDIAAIDGVAVAAGSGGLDRDVSSVYICDLLSFAMSKAPADSAWITVMNNINVMAVAALADVACVLLCEGAQPDAPSVAKAESLDLAILTSERPAFAIGQAIAVLMA